MTQAQSQVNLKEKQAKEINYLTSNSYLIPCRNAYICLYISSNKSLLVTINEYQNVLMCKDTETKT